jgi:hypothetical protein
VTIAFFVTAIAHDAGGSLMKPSMTAVALTVAVVFLAAFGSLAGPAAATVTYTTFEIP